MWPGSDNVNTSRIRADYRGAMPGLWIGVSGGTSVQGGLPRLSHHPPNLRRPMIRILIASVAFLGLTGPDGRLSFSKLVTIAVLALSAVTGTFGLGIAVAALSASFGVKAWLAFLTRHTSIASTTMHTDTAKAIEAIRKNRDDEHGVDPA